MDWAWLGDASAQEKYSSAQKKGKKHGSVQGRPVSLPACTSLLSKAGELTPARESFYFQYDPEIEGDPR